MDNNLNDQIVDLDNQEYNQDYHYQNGVEDYGNNNLPDDKMGQSDQIDSNLMLNEKKESSNSAKSFDPLG